MYWNLQVEVQRGADEPNSFKSLEEGYHILLNKFVHPNTFCHFIEVILLIKRLLHRQTRWGILCQ
jgi:hypothetical protein